MNANYSLSLSSVPVGCQHCHFLPFCQTANNFRQEKKTPEKLAVKIRKYERGDHLFQATDAFKTLYVIRSGTVKTYTFVQDGLEQVTGFHLAGKLLGLDVIGREQHIEYATALETCSICELSFSQVEGLRNRSPRFQKILWYAMSNEIRDEHDQLRLLSRTSAAARLASFLLNLSRLFQQRGYSANNFNLSLSRHDIANLLGLAVETVSRLFTQFQDEGLAIVERKHIVLNDMDGLKRISRINDEYARQTPHQLIQRRSYGSAHRE